MSDPDANLDLQVGRGQSLASISSIPTSWEWSYQGNPDIVASVAYDMWLSEIANSGGASPDSTFEMSAVGIMSCMLSHWQLTQHTT